MSEQRGILYARSFPDGDADAREPDTLTQAFQQQQRTSPTSELDDHREQQNFSNTVSGSNVDLASPRKPSRSGREHQQR